MNLLDMFSLINKSSDYSYFGTNIFAVWKKSDMYLPTAKQLVSHNVNHESKYFAPVNTTRTTLGWTHAALSRLEGPITTDVTATQRPAHQRSEIRVDLECISFDSSAFSYVTMLRWACLTAAVLENEDERWLRIESERISIVRHRARSYSSCAVTLFGGWNSCKYCFI